MCRIVLAVAVGVGALALPPLAAASTASVTEGTLSYTAGPGEANVVTIEANEVAPEDTVARLRITDTGAVIVPGAGCMAVSENEVECADADFASAFRGERKGAFVVRLGDGNDSVFLRVGMTDDEDPYGNTTSYMTGGAGDDRLEGGGTDDRLFGGPGRDVLVGGGGYLNRLTGGPGSDTFRGASSARRPASHAFFLDIVFYWERTNRVTVALDGRANDGEAGENDMVAADIEGVIGGPGNDTLIGNARNNILEGGAGADILRGGGDDDDEDEPEQLSGGHGADRISGCHSSWCYAFGGAGNDRIRARSGEIYGDRGDDLILGGRGHGVLDGGSGNDRVFGGRGNDYLYGQRGRDALFGGRGRDALLARDRARDAVNGGIGRDAACVDRRDRISSVERPCRAARL